MTKLFLVTDATAEQVRSATGIPATQSPFGAVVLERDMNAERDAWRMMAEVTMALTRGKTPEPACNCRGVFHKAGCPMMAS